MDKNQIISFIESQIAAGKITKQDLANIAGDYAAPSFVASPIQNSQESSRNLINVFYTIGAIIAVVGVAILVGQHWNEIGFVGRLFVSLGISFIAYVVALVMRGPQHRIISQVMFTVSAALAPLGAYVLLNEAGAGFEVGTQIVTTLILAIVYLVAYFISKRNILIFITAAFASWMYFAAVFKMFSDLYRFDNDYVKWATMLIGIAYIFLAYGLNSLMRADDAQDTKEKRGIQSLLYGAGTLATLGAGIMIGGIFDLFFILMVFAAFYLSVYLRSRSMLLFGALFLMAHIVKLTSEYFVGSIGWPVALILMGFVVIGIGYFTFYLNRKFIAVK